MPPEQVSAVRSESADAGRAHHTEIVSIGGSGAQARPPSRLVPTRGGGPPPPTGHFRPAPARVTCSPAKLRRASSVVEGVHVTIVRRGWRSGFELLLVVLTLVLGVGLSLLTNEAPSGPVTPIGRLSALHVQNAADAAGARQWTSNRAAASSDSSDADDDDDDGDDICAAPAIASSAPQVDRAVSWLLIHPVFEPPSSRASDGHSLRAPPQ